jgi:hypothetical protein
VFSDNVLEAVSNNVGHIVNLDDLQMELNKAGMRCQHSLLSPQHLAQMLCTINYEMGEDIPFCSSFQSKPKPSTPVQLEAARVVLCFPSINR